MQQPRIAFFGLGAMGSGMARRLLAAGHPVTVYNRNAAKAEPLRAEGATIAASPAEAAREAAFLISMVADDEASRGVWLGAAGALSQATPGALLIESSTLSLSWIRQLATEALKARCELIDAPVTGSKPQAASGELNFLVGGSEAAVEKAEPILYAMGRTVVRLGPSGSGALLKLINNFICGVQVAALAEGVAMIERSGLDAAAALQILTSGAPGSPLVKTISARMTAGEFDPPNFMLRLMTKDLAYASGEAAGLNVDLLTARAARQLFQSAIDRGDGDLDLSAVVRQFRAATPEPVEALS